MSSAIVISIAIVIAINLPDLERGLAERFLPG